MAISGCKRVDKSFSEGARVEKWVMTTDLHDALLPNDCYMMASSQEDAVAALKLRYPCPEIPGIEKIERVHKYHGHITVSDFPRVHITRYSSYQPNLTAAMERLVNYLREDPARRVYTDNEFTWRGHDLVYGKGGLVRYDPKKAAASRKAAEGRHAREQRRAEAENAKRAREAALESWLQRLRRVWSEISCVGPFYIATRSITPEDFTWYNATTIIKLLCVILDYEKKPRSYLDHKLFVELCSDLVKESKVKGSAFAELLLGAEGTWEQELRALATKITRQAKRRKKGTQHVQG